MYKSVINQRIVQQLSKFMPLVIGIAIPNLTSLPLSAALSGAASQKTGSVCMLVSYYGLALPYAVVTNDGVRSVLEGLCYGAFMALGLLLIAVSRLDWKQAASAARARGRSSAWGSFGADTPVCDHHARAGAKAWWPWAASTDAHTDTHTESSTLLKTTDDVPAYDGSSRAHALYAL